MTNYVYVYGLLSQSIFSNTCLSYQLLCHYSMNSSKFEPIHPQLYTLFFVDIKNFIANVNRQ